MTSEQSKSIDLLGIKFNALTMDEVLNICEQNILKKKSLLLGVVNVAKLVNCQRNTQLYDSIKDADIVLADGLPIIWLSNLIGNPLPERVPGIDIMYQLLKLSSRKNYKVFFLGATKEVIKKVVDTVEKEYPGVHVAGYRDGYFKQSESENVAREIKNSSADILFVAISSPKKEIFLKNWQSYMNISVCHGVGGSFDILAGITKRAPVCMQKWGFEWLFRLIQEPRRMWKRYLVTNTIYFKLCIKEIIRHRLIKKLENWNFKRNSTT